jgi:hypothetical protein
VSSFPYTLVSLRMMVKGRECGKLMLMSNSGISADSLLCIQRDGKDWGVYSSLPSAVTLLREHSQGVFTVKVYFAETDVMIGKGGQGYFEKCWREGNVEGEGHVRFETKVVEGTDHDNIPLTEKGVIGDVFKEVKKLYG